MDHLLFVFALMLIVGSTRQLLVTITAFTLAHSINLGAATLGFVNVPQQPVEAVIALSILFLAVHSWSARASWLCGKMALDGGIYLRFAAWLRLCGRFG